MPMAHLDHLGDRVDPDLNVAVALTEHHSSDGEQQRPDQAASCGPNQKWRHWHQFNPCRDRNQGANTRNQPTPKDQGGAITAKPAATTSQLLGTNADPAADAIPRQRSQHRSNQTGKNNRDELQLSLL